MVVIVVSLRLLKAGPPLLLLEGDKIREETLKNVNLYFMS